MVEILFYCEVLMTINYQPNRPVTGADPCLVFDSKGKLVSDSLGKEKARIRLNPDDKLTHAIALEGTKVLRNPQLKEGKWGKFLRAIGIRRWVLLKVKVEGEAGGGQTYARVNANSLKKRFGITDQEFDRHIQKDGIDFSTYQSVRTMLEQKEQVEQLTPEQQASRLVVLREIQQDGRKLQQYPEYQNDLQIVMEAIKKNPEAIQFIGKDPKTEEAVGKIIQNKKPQIQIKWLYQTEQPHLRLAKLSPDVQQSILEGESDVNSEFFKSASPKVQYDFAVRDSRVVYSKFLRISKEVQCQILNDRPHVFGLLSDGEKYKFGPYLPLLNWWKFPKESQDELFERSSVFGHNQIIQNENAPLDAILGACERNPKLLEKALPLIESQMKQAPLNEQRRIVRNHINALPFASPKIQVEMAVKEKERCLQIDYDVRSEMAQKTPKLYRHLFTKEELNTHREHRR